jgi:hypothetical protein
MTPLCVTCSFPVWGRLPLDGLIAHSIPLSIPGTKWLNPSYHSLSPTAVDQGKWILSYQ